MAKLGQYTASPIPYCIENNTKVMKVVNPYYCKEERVIYANCPFCGNRVDRLYNMQYCGFCGGRMTWRDMSVKDYGDVM